MLTKVLDWNDSSRGALVKMGILPVRIRVVHYLENNQMAERPIAKHSRTQRISDNWQHF